MFICTSSETTVIHHDVTVHDDMCFFNDWWFWEDFKEEQLLLADIIGDQGNQ